MLAAAVDGALNDQVVTLWKRTYVESHILCFDCFDWRRLYGILVQCRRFRAACDVPLLISVAVAVPNLDKCVQSGAITPIDVHAFHMILPRRINCLFGGVVAPLLVVMPIAIPDLQPLPIFSITTWNVEAFRGIRLISNLPTTWVELPRLMLRTAALP